MAVSPPGERQRGRRRCVQVHRHGASAEANAGDLTSWQERHAVIVLSKAKELAKIRYDLCPRHMKDKQFWRIYFLLAKSYISPSILFLSTMLLHAITACYDLIVHLLSQNAGRYELRAIQKEKLRRMETENGMSKEVITVEVEMQESKGSRVSQPSEVDLESQV
ncbi:hypothetical protein BAE44_0007054 [Dichanthelium oligosanthes]|uniref:BSD domain-containing protein n=1 Tax=Dichanthelium oligosanthes TaxID=888268 RepID=A0A1E5W3P5_9POAL|nr:hypothetical protein BAE44_0007054 [Dichanthelium oligosanthes]